MDHRPHAVTFVKSLPRSFDKPIYLQGHRTNYIAIPRRQIIVKPTNHITGLPISATLHQIIRCDDAGRPIRRIRMKKKERLILRRAHARLQAEVKTQRDLGLDPGRQN